MICLRPRIQEEPELNQTLPQSLYTLHRVPEELTSDAECVGCHLCRALLFFLGSVFQPLNTSLFLPQGKG